MNVTILDTQTGQTHQSTWDTSPFWWEEGNGSCDCNRAIQCGHDDDDDDDDIGVCLGHHRYLIVGYSLTSGELRNNPGVSLRSLNQGYHEALLEKFLPKE